MLAVDVRDVYKTYIRQGVEVHALDGMSIELHEGESLGIVGESGCGKSTLAKAICQMIPFDSGTIEVLGNQLPMKRGEAKRSLYPNIQMVFQNPVDSFDPKATLGASIVEPACNFGMRKAEAWMTMLELLERVGLQPSYADRYPYQVSGGECQRAAIARALIVNPKILICDEATSALDVSAQAQVLQILRDLRDDFAFSCLFVSHDIAVVRNVCDRVVVMNRGRVVEEGLVDEVIENPEESYTKALLASVLSVGHHRVRERGAS